MTKTFQGGCLRTRQYDRGFDDAMNGNAFGHQNEANSYPARERELDDVYRDGWNDGREKKHPTKASSYEPCSDHRQEGPVYDESTTWADS